MSPKKYNHSLYCSHPPSLCSLSPSPHHLLVSHHCEGRKPWRASQPDLFNVQSIDSFYVVRVCVCMHACVCACICGRQLISQRRREKRLYIFNSAAPFDMRSWWRGVKAGWSPWRIARIDKHTYTHWSVPLLVSQVVLRFDLDTVGQPKPPSLTLSLPRSLWLRLPPCSRQDGWPDSLGVFRLWRDPNFLF